MYADDVALPAFTRRTSAVQQSIDMACRRVVGLLLWAHAGTERRTDAVPLHTVRAMPINVKEETSLFWRVQYTLHDHYSLRVQVGLEDMHLKIYTEYTKHCKFC